MQVIWGAWRRIRQKVSSFEGCQRAEKKKSSAPSPHYLLEKIHLIIVYYVLHATMEQDKSYLIGLYLFMKKWLPLFTISNL